MGILCKSPDLLSDPTCYLKNPNVLLVVDDGHNSSLKLLPSKGLSIRGNAYAG